MMLVRISSREKRLSKSPLQSLQSRNFSTIQAARPAGESFSPQATGKDWLDTNWPCLYYSDMNDLIAITLIQAAHRVEARIEQALACVGLSNAKFEELSVLVKQHRPISLSDVPEKVTCVRPNVTRVE